MYTETTLATERYTVFYFGDANNSLSMEFYPQSSVVIARLIHVQNGVNRNFTFNWTARSTLDIQNLDPCK